MNDFIVARRADDSVISVQQNNSTKNLTITSLNKPAELLLNYTNSELSNKPLSTILNKNLAEDLNNYLEYTNDGTDLFDIISKMSNLTFIGKNNNNVTVKPKIFRTTTFDRNIINYEFLIRDTTISQKLDIFRKSIFEDTKYQMHPMFNIMDESSTIEEIKIILDFLHKYNIKATIVMLNIDPPHNSSTIDNLTKSTIDLLHKNIRESDIIGYFGEYKVICILLGCKSEDAYSVVSRLHKNINNKLETSHTKVSISYAQMYNEIDATELINKVNKMLFIAQQETGGGSIKDATNIV
ncbi:GGDEF domain-containing protein [Ehrlichia ruminantium]|uniref:GGDEF domain-containing protein n=1 Tax=Ehrlichia ruminantium TaxID=779 RepID=A0AAE6QBQ0_EHRRU|nr:GGDEF domain-containing protein [Ehrlichia ruminantium]QGR02716.1 GGDEF domain-containing protein [Ehrlichia ruminantium]QGR03636.1 GGDEF domain-containing protein [Ehrlichia ruminantium]QGR04563.1 GGDEF domain-containing protein [Ehrlichia ruminantium]